jgi:hypothetical protein
MQTTGFIPERASPAARAKAPPNKKEYKIEKPPALEKG